MALTETRERELHDEGYRLARSVTHQKLTKGEKKLVLHAGSRGLTLEEHHTYIGGWVAYALDGLGRLH